MALIDIPCGGFGPGPRYIDTVANVPARLYCAPSTMPTGDIFMRSCLIPLSFVLFAAFPADGAAQSAQSIMQQCSDAEIARLADVNSVEIKKTIMGNGVTEYMEKFVATTDTGHQVPTLRQVPLHELQRRQSGGNALDDASPEELERAADAIDSQRDTVASEYDKELAKSGLGGIPGLQQAMIPPPDQPWLTTNPQGMMGMYAFMLRSSADAKRATAGEDGRAEATTKIDDRAQLAQRLQRVGRETIDNRSAHHLRAEDLNHTQAADGQEFTIQSASLWIDEEKCVPLKLKMEGVAVVDNQSRPITIERTDSDYRNIEGCGLYEPYRQTMRIAGVTDAKQQAEMQEAQQKMAEFEKQLAQMPPSQRDMILQRMGPQMEMMRTMASGGGIEIVTDVQSIRCNPVGPPEPLDMAVTAMGGSAAQSAVDRDILRPYYVDETGIGVLRFADLARSSSNFFLAIRKRSENPGQTGEVLIDRMGPYVGPEFALYIGSLSMMGAPFEQLELEIFQDDPYRRVARYRPEVNPTKAEGMENCGSVSSSGECAGSGP
jgi:hypothetical protein